jgi:hypothetical protein
VPTLPQDHHHTAEGEASMSETTMSEYIKGFNDGYAFVLTQIERHPEMTATELLAYLKGDLEDKSQVNDRGIATG